MLLSVVTRTGARLTTLLADRRTAVATGCQAKADADAAIGAVSAGATGRCVVEVFRADVGAFGCPPAVATLAIGGAAAHFALELREARPCVIAVIDRDDLGHIGQRPELIEDS